MNATAISPLALERLGLLTILALGVSSRLLWISQPMLDHWSWREADVAMIAENFYRHGFHILYPQINWGGAAPGYVGTEFPLIPAIAALGYRLFGVRDWIGRLVSVLFFAASVPCLYRLVKRYSSPRAALVAVGVYSFAPLGVFASRSFMSDMASLSLSIAGLDLFAAWLVRKRDAWLLVAASLCVSLAILVKLPAAIIGLPLGAMAWEKYGRRLVGKRALWAFAGIALSAPLAWYTHAYLLSRAHFPYHFFGEGGIAVESLDWYLGIIQRTVMSGLTPIVCAAMLVGILWPAPARGWYLFHWWLGGMLVFIVVAGPGNRHEWYQLPLVPVAAAYAGLAYEGVRRKVEAFTVTKRPLWYGYVAFWGGLAALSYLAVAPLYGHQRPALWETGQELRRIIPPDALVIVADDGDPRAIYYSQRKGWHLLRNGRFEGYPEDDQEAIALLEQFRRKGAGYLAFPRDGFWWFDRYQGFKAYLDTHYERVSGTNASVIFDVTSSRVQ